MISGPNDKRLRLTGTIELAPRGSLLRCADGSLWKLELDEVDLPANTLEIIVEGRQSGLDQLTVDWIGQAEP